MTVELPARELRAGDVVDVWWAPRRAQIERIEPYRGPLDCVLAVAYFVVGPPMSLCEGDWFTVFNRGGFDGER